MLVASLASHFKPQAPLYDGLKIVGRLPSFTVHRPLSALYRPCTKALLSHCLNLFYMLVSLTSVDAQVQAPKRPILIG